MDERIHKVIELFEKTNKRLDDIEKKINTIERLIVNDMFENKSFVESEVMMLYNTDLDPLISKVVLEKGREMAREEANKKEKKNKKSENSDNTTEIKKSDL